MSNVDVGVGVAEHSAACGTEGAVAGAREEMGIKALQEVSDRHRKALGHVDCGYRHLSQGARITLEEHVANDIPKYAVCFVGAVVIARR